MLSEEQLLRVYELLDGEVVEGDCGEKCGAFCCTGAAVKYLLPGEEKYFRRRHPDVSVVQKPWYPHVFQSECCCVREHRMFTCRAFPFRPLISRSTGDVVDMVKTDNEVFEPCWIKEPLPEWRERSIEAWRIVLADRDCRMLYGRVRFLANTLDELGERFYEIAPDKIDNFFLERIDEAGEESIEALWMDYFPCAEK